MIQAASNESSDQGSPEGAPAASAYPGKGMRIGEHVIIDTLGHGSMATVFLARDATGHEVMRAAARLADESRELEKANDSVSRRPHARTGEIMSKTRLLEKPEKI